MPEVLEKVKFTREVCDKLSIRAGGKTPPSGVVPTTLPPFDIQVDGGIDAETAKQCVQAGANVLVSGTYFFKALNMTQAVTELRECCSH